MIVDCGGCTIDLTTRKFTENRKIYDFCGNTFIDKEFIKFLHKKLGNDVMDLLRNNRYGQLQCMVQDFCQHVKIPSQDMIQISCI